MNPTFDLAQALGGLTDRADAWRLIEAFAAAWANPLSDGDGFSDETLDLAEAALGVRLPAAVREAYGLLGRRDDLTSVNGTLYPPGQLRYDATADILVFRAAHQAVAYFGVSLATAADDPPVLLYVTYADKAEESWEPFMDRFSLACVDMGSTGRSRPRTANGTPSAPFAAQDCDLRSIPTRVGAGSRVGNGEPAPGLGG